MKPRILIIIDSDPRRSGRAAEGVRIAAGVAAWKQVEVSVYLRGEAAMVLGEDTDALVDGDSYERYWPVLRESGQSVCVQKGAATLAQPCPVALPFEEISDEQLAEMAAGCCSVLRF